MRVPLIANTMLRKAAELRASGKLPQAQVRDLNTWENALRWKISEGKGAFGIRVAAENLHITLKLIRVRASKRAKAHMRKVRR